MSEEETGRTPMPGASPIRAQVLCSARGTRQGRPRTAADLRDLLAQSSVELRAGKLDPKLANSISYLGAGRELGHVTLCRGLLA